MDTGADSLRSGLITLVVRGNQEVFGAGVAQNYYVELEALTTVHFLDEAKFDTFQSMITQGTAYTVRRNAQSGLMEIAVSAAAQGVCNGAVDGFLSCVIRQDIRGRSVLAPGGVKSFSSGYNESDEGGTELWLRENLLGFTDNSEELAYNFSSMVRSRYELDHRTRRAWLLNPGYNWPMPEGGRTILELSDRTIIIAILTLNDADGNMVTSRRLLSTLGGGRQLLAVVPPVADTLPSEAVERLMASPRNGHLPAIRNELDHTVTFSRIYGRAHVPHRLMSVVAAGAFDRGVGAGAVCKELIRRMQANRARFCPTCVDVFFPLCNVRVVPAGGGRRRRRLLQMEQGMSNVRTNLTVLFVFKVTRPTPPLCPTDPSARECPRRPLCWPPAHAHQHVSRPCAGHEQHPLLHGALSEHRQQRLQRFAWPDPEQGGHTGHAGCHQDAPADPPSAGRDGAGQPRLHG